MYSTNITNSKTHVFLQFWFFSSWSASITDLENAWHEGDLEYFQIAIAKKDRRYISNNAGESKRDWVAPIGVFGSQHYYGQTLAWDRYTEHSRPQSQILQTSVTHEANRPYVYAGTGLILQ